MSFKNDVELIKPYIYLTDIVSIADGNEAFVDKLAAVKIAKSPLPMQSMIITQKQINVRLEKYFPGVTQDVAWNGTKTTKVSSNGVLTDISAGYRLSNQTLLTWLESRLGQAKGQVSVQQVNKARDLVLPRGTVTYKARIDDNKPLVERFPVWLDVLIDGEVNTSFVIWFSVKHIKPVWVAKRHLEKNELLKPEDWILLNKNIVHLSAEDITPQFPEDSRTTKFISIGSIMTSADIELQPLITNEDIVSVKSHSGLITITVEAKAKTDGYLNEIVMLESLTSGDVFQAQVTGSGKAEVF